MDRTPEHTVFTVFALAPGSMLNHSIAARSAIVSPQADDAEESRRIHFEGNVYEWECLAHYTTRLLHAAGRAAHRYPTIARAVVPAADLVPIGTYDLESMVFTATDAPGLSIWLDGEALA